MGTKLALLGMLLLGALAPAARATDAGLTLSLHVPPTYHAGTPFLVEGRLAAFASLPVFETAAGLPKQDVQIKLNGSVVATVQTDLDGRYSTTFTFGNELPTSRIFRAVALGGTPLVTSSQDASTVLDRVWQRLYLDPGVADVAAGGTTAFRAWAEDADGRLFDVTEDAVWTSGSPDIAAVSDVAGSRGVVTGVAAGSATISASFESLSALATVTVS